LNKDDYVFAAAKLLKELLTVAGVEWDEAYYRYAEYPDEDAWSSQWSCRKGKYLKVYLVDQELAEEYTVGLEKIMDTLCGAIEAEGHTRPIVVVLRVDTTGRYTMKFERQDIKAMQIDSLNVGKPNSLFGVGEVLVDPDL
jgi:hypothetical protein